MLMALVGLVATGCLGLGSATPVQRVTDASRELNLATRFGQLEVAVPHVDGAARTEFLSRRAQWGKMIRILDVELSGIHVADEEHATTTVDVAWSSVSDSLLRATKLMQEWESKRAGWLLVRERRLSGDTGLFGEAMPELEAPHPDVHRPTRTIR
jgi:hypothetical protein